MSYNICLSVYAPILSVHSQPPPLLFISLCFGTSPLSLIYTGCMFRFMFLQTNIAFLLSVLSPPPPSSYTSINGWTSSSSLSLVSTLLLFFNCILLPPTIVIIKSYNFGEHSYVFGNYNGSILCNFRKILYQPYLIISPYPFRTPPPTLPACLSLSAPSFTISHNFTFLHWFPLILFSHWGFH